MVDIFGKLGIHHGAFIAVVGGMDFRHGAAYERVDAWRLAHVFVLGVYRYSAGFPPAERFGLAAQLRRAAVSVPSNFAEGYGRLSPAEKARFYNVAQGSLNECRYQLLLSEELGYGDSSDLRSQGCSLSKMLSAYVREMLRRTRS